MRRVYKKPDYQFSKLGHVDGFHAEIFNDATYVLIEDGNGDPIPSDVCCCCACYETECVCGGFKNPPDSNATKIILDKSYEYVIVEAQVEVPVPGHKPNR